MYVAGSYLIVVLDGQALIDIGMFFVVGNDIADDHFALYRFRKHAASWQTEELSNELLAAERRMDRAAKGDPAVQVIGTSFVEYTFNASYAYDQLIDADKSVTVAAEIHASNVQQVAFEVALKFNRSLFTSELLTIPFEGSPAPFLFNTVLRLPYVFHGDLGFVARNDAARRKLARLQRDYR